MSHIATSPNRGWVKATIEIADQKDSMPHTRRSGNWYDAHDRGIPTACIMTPSALQPEHHALTSKLLDEEVQV
jgi:hypothetical protein